MKTLDFPWFPWRWVATVLLLLAGDWPLLAVPTVTLPPANLSLSVGQTATFTAEASTISANLPLSVQWQMSTDGGNTFNPVTGTTTTVLPTATTISTTYSYSSVTVNEYGHQFRAVFSDATVGDATTAPATLTVVVGLPQGRIMADITLDPGPPGSQTPDFIVFFTSSEGVEPNDGGGVSGRSPVWGDVNYPDLCVNGSMSLNYPYINTTPLQPLPTALVTLKTLPSIPVPQDYFKAEFTMSPGTDQLRDPSTSVPITPGMRDYLCIPYWIDPQLKLGPNGTKKYNLESFRCDALLPFNSQNGNIADVRSIVEPVGAIRVVFQCDPGIGVAPLKVLSARITATIQDSPAIPLAACAPLYRDLAGASALIPGENGTVQAMVDFAPVLPADLDVTFLVRSGHGYGLTVEFVVGAAVPITATLTVNTGVAVQQGKVVTIIKEVSKFFCDGGSGCFSAKGRLEMVGTSVFGPGGCLPPIVEIRDGPLGFAVPALVTPDPDPQHPGAAHYELIDVPPSHDPDPPPDWPAKDYLPRAQFYFETGNGFLQYMDMYAERRFFECVGFEELDPMFVMDHGVWEGNIHLVGPSCTAPQSCLQLITAPPVTPCADHFWYGAPYVLASGYTYAYSTIKGNLTSPTLFEGSYRLWLTRPNQPPPPGPPVTPAPPPYTFAHWTQDQLVLRLHNPANPTHQSAYLYIEDRLADNLCTLIPPGSGSGLDAHTSSGLDVHYGQTYVNHHDYCLSEITLTLVRANPNEQIADPQVNCSGTYGLKSALGPVPKPDYHNQPAAYRAIAEFYGMPAQYAATDGNIRFCLPQGDDYEVTASVRFIDQFGKPGTSPFPPFRMTVDCGVCYGVVLTPDGLGPIITTTHGPCTSQQNYGLQGTVQAAAGHTITDVSYSVSGVNGVTTGQLCPGNCGTTFNLSGVPIPLQTCVNTVTITATDDQGLPGSATFTITLDTIPPVLTGCANITVPSQAGQSGAVVTFTPPPATDTCDGVVQPVCSPPSGSLFNTGCTEVTCTAADTCGHQSTCKFTVCVVESGRAEGCSLTQGFYGNPKGKFNGTPSLTWLNSLLMPPLVVGTLGVRSLTIPASDSATLQARLPAGGPSAALPNSDDRTLATVGVPLNKGKFGNILLGQTLTLSLNVRLDANLLNFPLPASFCTQGTLPGSDAKRGTFDDTLVAGEFQQFIIAASVLSALSSATLGIMNGTVEGLLELANRGLAGQTTGGASLSDINAAVDAINRGFDNCRVLVDCVTHVPVPPSANDNFGNPIILGGGDGGNLGAGLLAAAKVVPQNGPVTEMIRTKGFNGAASKETGEPNIAGNPGGRSVWWRWNASQSGWVRIETAGSSFDTLLGIYVGQSISNLTLIASNDDTPTLVTAEVAFRATAGTNYLIVVDGYNGASGDIALELVAGVPRLGPVTLLAGGELRVGIEGELGRLYTIEGSTDLVAWTSVVIVENTSGTLQFVDPEGSTLNHRFYRVVFEP